MTPKQHESLKQILKRVPIDLLKKEIKRRYDLARSSRQSKMGVCSLCHQNVSRTNNCPGCNLARKLYYRNRYRQKHNISIDLKDQRHKANQSNVTRK